MHSWLYAWASNNNIHYCMPQSLLESIYSKEASTKVHMYENQSIKGIVINVIMVAIISPIRQYLDGFTSIASYTCFLCTS